MSGHTPGPWTATKVPTSVGHAWKFDPCGGCIYVDDRGGVEWRPADEAEANARLIAAAPELLEALEAAVAVINATIGVVDNIRHDDSLALIEAAILKARGKA